MKIDFKEEYVLENELVKLIPLQLFHFEKLLDFSENEPELWRYNSGGANGSGNLKVYIENAIHQRDKELEYPFIVFNKQKNKYVGSTRFYSFKPHYNNVDIGYTWYGKEFHGDGTNKNCKLLLLDFAFNKLQVERVGFAASALNVRSVNAMKSIGCVEEGTFRNYCLDNYGNRIDAIFLSILRNEWFANVEQDLRNKIDKIL